MSDKKKVEGDLSSFSIFDITQTLLAGRKTARVTIESGIRRGYVSFKEGQIVHAIDDQLVAGEKAVYAIFSWRKGAFTIDFDFANPETNITTPTDFLLLEIARQFDEASRDGGAGATDESVEQTVEERLSAKLKHKLTTIFKTVAERAEPARDRHTRQVFDGLLGPLLELRGSALFLRRGLQPRVKSPEGFITLKDAIVDEDEVSGFLMSILSEGEAAVLRERKEVTTLYDGGQLGAFRIGVFEEAGAPTILITPARREIPGLDSFGMGPAGEAIARIVDGIVVVAGPIGSGKTSLLASLVAHHAQQRDKFAVAYSSEQIHAFPSGRGFVMQRSRPVGGAELGMAVRTAIDQGADIVAVDPVTECDDFRLLLEVASTGRLVIAAMQTLSFGETLSRLQGLTQESAGERIARLVADLLRAVVALPTRRPNESASAEVLLVGRDEQSLLRKRDFAALRMQHAIAGV